MLRHPLPTQVDHELDRSLDHYLVRVVSITNCGQEEWGQRNLKVRLLKDLDELSSGSVVFWQVVEGIQDLCDQLNIILPHSF